MTTQTIKLTTKRKTAGRPRKNAAASIIEVDTTESVTTETDEQIVERLRERFGILDEMTQMSVDGDIRGMVVTGPPGVGKSFGVENVIEKNCKDILNKLQQKNILLLNDKSSPEDITAQLNMSKKAFKKAIGVLYKKKKIKINSESISLI